MEEVVHKEVEVREGKDLENCLKLGFCFNKNFFGQKHESAILTHKNLNKKTVQTLLNELFPLDTGNNEEIIQEHIL